jgi:hypothetical protein
MNYMEDRDLALGAGILVILSLVAGIFLGRKTKRNRKEEDHAGKSGSTVPL